MSQVSSCFVRHQGDAHDAFFLDKFAHPFRTRAGFARATAGKEQPVSP
jgi:hypothetical protein